MFGSTADLRITRARSRLSTPGPLGHGPFSQPSVPVWDSVNALLCVDAGVHYLLNLLGPVCLLRANFKSHHENLKTYVQLGGALRITQHTYVTGLSGMLISSSEPRLNVMEVQYCIGSW